MAGSLFSNAVISFFVNTKQAVGALGDLQNKFTGTTSKILGTLGAVAGVRGLKGVYNLLRDVVHLAEKWNLPIEDVSRFMNLFSQFGGDAEEALKTVEQLEKLANSLGLHSEGAFKNLSALINQNLQAKDYQGALDTFRSVFNQLANLPNGRNAQAELLDMIGADYPALLRMLRASDDEYAQMVEQASTMRVFTKEMANNLTDVEKKLADIKQRWVGIGAVVSETFKPVVDVLYEATKLIDKLPDKVIQAFVIVTVVLGGFLAKWAAMIAASAIGKLLGIGTTAAATTAASTAGAATAGAATAGAGGAALSAGTVAAGATVAAIVGALYPTPAGETPEQMAELRAKLGANNNSIVGDLGTKEALTENEIQRNLYLMRQLASKQLYDEKWGQSKIPGTNSTDNRSVTINIYGVDGAADMMERLRGLPMNNMSPISWK